MNPVQRPRDEHGSSDPHPSDSPAPDPRASAHEASDPDASAPGAPATGATKDRTRDARDRSQYGIRLDPSAQASGPGAGTTPPARPDAPQGTSGGRGTARGSAAQGARAASSSGAGTAPATAAEDPAARSAAARAARRMGRGLSFTVIMLGVLAGLALVAMDVWFGWVVGTVLVVLGALGYALVQTRALPVLQDPGEPERRSWSKLWLIPAVLLLPGFACLGMAFVVPSWLGPTVPADLLDDYVLAFIVGGMTMIVGAGLGFGLVATARFTRPDDDDSPLRPTDYAERLRERERPEGGDYYDSDWIRRDPRT
ncbi:hypothetical protein [Kocuria rhizophila]|uniref:hypothetical protein n=1 Tax=Kocuria rhizophila TaxID=72000 RepID=UPI00294B5F3E|nr:hypothetical protein [Kocuria rhizophila]